MPPLTFSAIHQVCMNSIYRYIEVSVNSHPLCTSLSFHTELQAIRFWLDGVGLTSNNWIALRQFHSLAHSRLPHTLTIWYIRERVQFTFLAHDILQNPRKCIIRLIIENWGNIFGNTDAEFMLMRGSHIFGSANAVYLLGKNSEN